MDNHYAFNNYHCYAFVLIMNLVIYSIFLVYSDLAVRMCVFECSKIHIYYYSIVGYSLRKKTKT